MQEVAALASHSSEAMPEDTGGCGSYSPYTLTTASKLLWEKKGETQAESMPGEGDAALGKTSAAWSLRRTGTSEVAEPNGRKEKPFWHVQR